MSQAAAPIPEIHAKMAPLRIDCVRVSAAFALDGQCPSPTQVRMRMATKPPPNMSQRLSQALAGDTAICFIPMLRLTSSWEAGSPANAFAGRFLLEKTVTHKTTEDALPTRSDVLLMGATGLVTLVGLGRRFVGAIYANNHIPESRPHAAHAGAGGRAVLDGPDMDQTGRSSTAPTCGRTWTGPTPRLPKGSSPRCPTRSSTSGTAA